MKIMQSVCLFRYLCFVPVLLLIGCTQTVTFYDGRHVPDRELATLEFPFSARVRVEQKEVAPDRGGFTHYIRVKLLPKDYPIEWIEKSGDYTFVYQGSGTLKAQAGQRYVIKSCYLPGMTRMTGTSIDRKYFSTEVLDIATWIENMETHEVVVGTKPPWADSTSVRPPVLLEF